MEGTWTILLGIVLGVVGALPSAALLELALRGDRRANVATGTASIFASFVMLTVALLVVWGVSRESVLPFGIAVAASFLAVWVVEACRAWRDAQRGASPRERKSGEPTRQTRRGDG